MLVSILRKLTLRTRVLVSVRSFVCFGFFHFCSYSVLFLLLWCFIRHPFCSVCFCTTFLFASVFLSCSVRASVSTTLHKSTMTRTNFTDSTEGRPSRVTPWNSKKFYGTESICLCHSGSVADAIEVFWNQCGHAGFVAHRRTENDSQVSDSVTPVNTTSDFIGLVAGFMSYWLNN